MRPSTRIAPINGYLTTSDVQYTEFQGKLPCKSSGWVSGDVAMAGRLKRIVNTYDRASVSIDQPRYSKTTCPVAAMGLCVSGRRLGVGVTKIACIRSVGSMQVQTTGQCGTNELSHVLKISSLTKLTISERIRIKLAGTPGSTVHCSKCSPDRR